VADTANVDDTVVVEAAPKKKETAAARAKRVREWEALIDELPDLIHPLALPDNVQLELLAIMDDVRMSDVAATEDNLGGLVAFLKPIVAILPRLFVDSDEFEAWRIRIPLLARAEVYMKVYLHYVEAMGESVRSAS